MKKKIPNILTFIRIFSIPFIIIFYANEYLLTSFFIAFCAALTDLLDGYLSRKWKTTSELGRRLDVVADKLLAAGMLIALSFSNPLMIINLMLEFFITVINLTSFYFKNNPKTNYIGKIKTFVLFMTMILGFVLRFNIFLEPLFLPLYSSTIILQLYAIYSYVKLFIQNEQKKKTLNKVS